MKKLISLLLASVMCMGIITGCGKDNAGTINDGTNDATIEGKKTLVVGLDTSFPPMGFKDEKGEIVGFDIDLAKEVGKRAGFDVKLQPIDWSQKFLELESGKVDVLWNGLTIDDERIKQTEMSKPYLSNSQVIVVKKGSTITEKKQLADKKIGVQIESTAMNAIKKDDVLKLNKNVTEYDENVKALNDVKIGRIDALVVDKVVAEYLASKDKDAYVILSEELAPEKYGFAAKKGNTELMSVLQKTFDEMIADGKAAEISKKWFGEDRIVK